MEKIYREIIRCKRQGLKGVLGTIISTQGSTYQKTGAKCFIAEDGRLTGLVSGGCVEGDMKEMALDIIEAEKPRIIHYDFQDENDLIWGLGLGCNGKITIWLEPYLPNSIGSQQLEDMFKLGLDKPIHCLTITEAAKSQLIGTRWIIDPEETETDHIPFTEIVNDYVSRKDMFQRKLITIASSKEKFQVFYDAIFPQPRLVLFGGGPDAVPLVKMAKQMNWHVTVLDHRPGVVNSKNFPEADDLILFKAGEPPALRLEKNTYVVLMSHHFLHDQMMLKEVIHSHVAYIGILGPRKRTVELGKGLGIDHHPNLKIIHSPIGLNLGAVTPEEIALSILAEIVMHYRGGEGTKLTKEPLQFSSKEEEPILEI
ncbi:XdhC family protein [Bacillus rubiinfantis]|uniref:XdhC family protein n=1 Tax=Bacillus rubiinfantis TaxID=1499680 RepID=UPI0005A6159C|nr:XdhC/CoxI family protein [Bacillus rubiinfantis]